MSIRQRKAGGNEVAGATALCTNAPALLAPHVEILRCPPAPGKSSSERGKAFRARRKAMQLAISQYNDRVRSQITQLETKQALFETVRVSRRHTSLGSLERIVREYYDLFNRGYQAAHSTSRGDSPQERFVMAIVDPDARIGDYVGPLALLQQWQLYTAAYAVFRGIIDAVEMVGSEDGPVVVVHSRVLTVISQTTFEVLFPHLLEDAEMQRMLIGREVVYKSTTRFQFTEAGRIKSEQLELDVISGFQRAGVALRDIEKLFQRSKLSPTYTIQAE